MVTRLYLRNASSTVTGTLPSAEQSTLTADDFFDTSNTDTINRSLSRFKGTSETCLQNASIAASTLKNYYVARFVSEPLTQTSVAANTWTYNFGAMESDGLANFPTSAGAAGTIYVNCYVWKPSDGTKYGTILDGTTGAASGESATTPVTNLRVNQVTFSGSAVSSLTSGDAVIVCEVWFKVTQGAANSYTQAYGYDGPTIWPDGSTSKTDVASYIETPEDLSISDGLVTTKLYLHATTSGLPSGTLPSAEQSTNTVTAACNFEGSQTTNRLMNTTIGTSQATLTLNTPANTNANNYYVSRWVSPVIYQTSVAAGTWTYNFAARESATTLNYPVNGTNKVVAVNCYVWKPSNGTKYGTILDGNTAATVTEGTANQERSQQADFTGASVSSLTSGDACIVFEVWFLAVTGSSGISAVADFMYDGTTETAAGSTVSNHASLISYFGVPIQFTAGGTLFSRPLSTETVSVSESLVEIYNANRAPTAETITISESILRDFDGVRAIAAQTTVIGEAQTRLFSANRPITAETNIIGESLVRLYASTRTLSDTTVISESLARLQGLIRTLTAETTVVSESLVRVFGVVRSLSDTITIGESLSRLLAVIRTLSDTSVIGESLAKMQVLVRTLSDTSAISESLTKILTLVRNIPVQTITIGESLVRVFVGVRALSAETSAISESLVRLKAATRALSDTTAISESLARIFGVVRSLSDTIVIGESLTRALAAIRALAAQTTTVGESLTKVQTLVRSLADTTIISETISRLLAATRALSTETSAIGESLTKVFTPASGVTAHRPLAAETIAVSESLARVSTNVRTIIETTIIAETLIRLQVLTRVLTTEITAISESLVSIKTLVRTLSQTTAISESLTKVVVLVRSLTETTIISETLTRLQVLTRALTTEITTISESLAAGKVLLKTLSETIPISDSLTKVADRIRSLVETVIIDESLSRVQVLTRALTTEISNISDSLSAVRPAIEVALIEFVEISENLVSVLYHIVPLYLTSKFVKIEGVAKRTRAYERDTESYMLKQLYRLIGRKYSVGRRSRSG